MRKKEKEKMLRNRLSGTQALMNKGANELALREAKSILEAAKRFKLKGIISSANQLCSKLEVRLKGKSKKEVISYAPEDRVALLMNDKEKVRRMLRVQFGDEFDTLSRGDQDTMINEMIRINKIRKMTKLSRYWVRLKHNLGEYAFFILWLSFIILLIAIFTSFSLALSYH